MSTPNKPSAASGSEPPPPSSAVEVAENSDLLTEILLRLPVKSLIRFKSVSTRWLSLISRPSFCLRHSRSPFSAAPVSGLFLERHQNGDNEYDFVGLNPSPSRPPFRSLPFFDVSIAHSCNGLLLCCNESRGSHYVYNPTTKHHAALPPPPPCASASPFCESTVWGVTLAFDPSRSPGYKAVCVRNSSGNPDGFWIEIYSSESGLWRPSDQGHFAADMLHTAFHRGVFWNGSVHWIDPWGPWLRFDVAAERLREIPAPPFPDDAFDRESRSSGSFAESGDHLHFIDCEFEQRDGRLKVFELERDYSGWFVRYDVDLSQVSAAFPEMIWGSEAESEFHGDSEARPDEYFMSVLCVARGEIEKDSFLVMNVPGKVLRFDLESGAFYKLCDVPMVNFPEMVTYSDEAYQYIESLVCV